MDTLFESQKLRNLGDKAIPQLNDKHFLNPLDDESNSIGIRANHMAKNMRSHWTDFLTTNDEKPDRHRDCEFKSKRKDTKNTILEQWKDG